MSKSLTDVVAFPTNITVPAAGEGLTAISVEVPFQQLANRTAYLNGAIAGFPDHLTDTTNPHEVTASQTGAYTSGQTDSAISTAIGTHSAAADPHAAYVKKAGDTMTGGLVTPSVSATSYVGAGPGTRATAGALRVANGQGLSGKDDIGNDTELATTSGADLQIGDYRIRDVNLRYYNSVRWLDWDGASYTEALRVLVDRLRPGPNNTMLFGDSTHYWSVSFITGMLGTYIALGTNPASSGNVRLASLGSAKARNAANSGNVDVWATDSSDRVVLGGSGCAAVRASDTGGGVAEVTPVVTIQTLS